MIGDQVYADEVSPQTLDFIRSRRDTTEPPWEQIADFEEYTRLYREAWSEPVVRWLLANVGTAMLFDDHDVHDDWNISVEWVEEMRSQPWWHDRITGALVAYWVYQHLGNVSPKSPREMELLEEVMRADDAWPLLLDWAEDADSDANGRRWSYSRTIGRKRFVFMDSREGRLLGESPRRMFDEDEWEWINDRVCGDVDHLVVADTLPVMLPPPMQDVEAWNEAVCAGAWGPRFARIGEKIRQGLDLEHWGAFQHSFRQLTDLFAEVGSGKRGAPPATIVTLGGDIHHAYLAEVGWRKGTGVQSAVWQAVCSPYRNPLDKRERRMAQMASTSVVGLIGKALSRAAGVPRNDVRWRLVEEPTFDNQIGTLVFDGPTRSCASRRRRPEIRRPSRPPWRGSWPRARGSGSLDPELLGVVLPVFLPLLQDVVDVVPGLGELDVVPLEVRPAPGGHVRLAPVVGGEGRDLVPVELVEQIAQVEGPVADVDVGIREVVGLEGRAAAEPLDQLGRRRGDLHQAARTRRATPGRETATPRRSPRR